MRRVMVLTLIFAFLISFASVARSQETEPAGQKMFVDKKCNTCHSIDAVKIAKKMAASKAPDLSTIGSDRTADWITKYLSKEEAIDGKKHGTAWTGKPEELKTLVDWLATLKKK